MKRIERKVTIKLFSLLFPNSNSKKYTIPFLDFVDKMIKDQGMIKTIKYLKQCRLHCTRFICSSPLLVNKMKIGIDPTG
jgi:hypothetical protein